MKMLQYEISYETQYGFYMRSNLVAGKYSDFTISEQDTGDRLTVTLSPHRPLKMHTFSVATHWECCEDDRILLNGYQSWTDTRELTIHDRMPGLTRVPKWLVKKFTFDGYGDYPMVAYSGKPRMLHGFSYGYIRHGDRYDFVGSLNELTGYTILKLNALQQRLTIEKECKELVISEPYPILDVAFLGGGYDEVFDRWFALQRIPKPSASPMSGYYIRFPLVF